MKKKNISILILMLLLASGAKAEIVYINCKFNEGWHQKGKDYESVRKSEDISLVWDKQKKFIKRNDKPYEPYYAFNDTFHWSHKWTGWYDKYVLNTINGNLTMTGYNRKENWETNFYYTCDKTQKKF
jgi:hypothetical protein